VVVTCTFQGSSLAAAVVVVVVVFVVFFVVQRAPILSMVDSPASKVKNLAIDVGGVERNRTI